MCWSCDDNTSTSTSTIIYRHYYAHVLYSMWQASVHASHLNCFSLLHVLNNDLWTHTGHFLISFEISSSIFVFLPLSVIPFDPSQGTVLSNVSDLLISSQQFNFSSLRVCLNELFPITERLYDFNNNACVIHTCKVLSYGETEYALDAHVCMNYLVTVWVDIS